MGKVKLTFSGDIMLANSTINFYKVNDGTYNFNRMFKDVKKNLEKSDFTVGNLETPITKNNEKIKYQQYRFTSPIEFAEAVNHCLDNGKYGIKETIDALNEIRNCKYWHIL